MITVMILMLRIYYFSVVMGDEIKKKADRQNTVSFDISPLRNDFLDRNNKHLTGLEKKKYIFVYTSKDDETDKSNANKISFYCDESSSYVAEKIKKDGCGVFRVTADMKSSEFENNRYVKVLYYPSRYLDDSPAAALIGYTADNKGIYGLERVYDNILTNNDKNFKVRTDANRNIIGNITVSGNTANERKIKTTLNIDFQRICQKALDEKGVKGGAVLLDVNTFDLLAMASSPSFESDKIESYLNDKDGALTNRCLMAYDMGSVFKIVVSAAALENNVDMSTVDMYCAGVKKVSGKVFECHNRYGHREQNFEDAFKNSCNCAFIGIGEKTGYENIVDMAEKFGLGQKNLYPTELEQQKGKLPDIDNYYLADLANISIGQGNLSGTVLNGAIISAVIAAKGIIKNVNCVDCITDSYGQKFVNLRSDKQERIISEKNADIIYNMMVETNKSGTGTKGQIENFGSGGKTGSAQTGWYVDGENYQHGWFTGFFPADNPQYALCVFVENGRSGSESAAPIFKEIGTKIMKYRK